MSSSAFGLLLRLVVGLVMMGHGAQKVFGWFGGPGWASSAEAFRSQGLKPGWLWALLAGVGEGLGGLLIALGLLSPLGEIAIFACMCMVIFKVHWKQGLWFAQGGYEYPLILLFVSVMLALVGSGSYSLDKLLGINDPALPLFGIGVLASIIVDGVGIATSRKTSIERAEDQAQRVR